MFKSDLAREAFQDGIPTLVGALNILRTVIKHEIDGRVDMRPHIIESRIEGELKEVTDELFDEFIGAIKSCS